MIRVLFLCTGNAGRSQMAEGLLRHLGGDKFDVHSAGTRPKGPSPLTVRSMAEIGIDISSHESKSLERYLDQQWDYVITLCDDAAESCPAFPGGQHRLHWPFPDPAAARGAESERLAAFRAIRDAIAERIRQFIQETAATSVD